MTGRASRKFRVQGTASTCDCGNIGYVIYDHRGWLYGCRPTFAEAMTYARLKATKAYRNEVDHVR